MWPLRRRRRRRTCTWRHSRCKLAATCACCVRTQASLRPALAAQAWQRMHACSRTRCGSSMCTLAHCARARAHGRAGRGHRQRPGHMAALRSVQGLPALPRCVSHVNMPRACATHPACKRHYPARAAARLHLHRWRGPGAHRAAGWLHQHCHCQQGEPGCPAGPGVRADGRAGKQKAALAVGSLRPAGHAAHTWPDGPALQIQKHVTELQRGSGKPGKPSAKYKYLMTQLRDLLQVGAGWRGHLGGAGGGPRQASPPDMRRCLPQEKHRGTRASRSRRRSWRMPRDTAIATS